MEVVEVEGGVTIFLSEYFCDINVLELVVKKGPFVVESDHGFNTLLTFLLERYGGGGLRRGVRCRCTFRIDCLRCRLSG